MSYNDLIGVVRETNRPPGGLRTVIEIAVHTFLRPGKDVLEVGTSTGFTAMELARLTGCQVTGIDINAASLAEAERRAVATGVHDLASFHRRNALESGFPDESFDVVVVGNVPSLVDSPSGLVSEATRVLRMGGFLAAVPMYYVADPPTQLVKDVSAAIQVAVEPRDVAFWRNLYTSSGLEIHWNEDRRFVRVPESSIDQYVDKILARPHLKALNIETLSALSSCYRRHLHLFNENLSYMGFTVMLLRRNEATLDPELFRSELALTPNCA